MTLPKFPESTIPKDLPKDAVWEGDIHEYEEWRVEVIKELREEIKKCKSIVKKYPKDTVGKAGQLATIAKNKEILVALGDEKQK